MADERDIDQVLNTLWLDTIGKSQVRRALIQAEARGRRQGVEDAAKECERGCGNSPIDAVLRDKARSIRSLLDNEG